MYGATKGAVTSSPGPSPSRARRSASGCNAICPAGDAVHELHGRGGLDVPAAQRSRSPSDVGAMHPLGRPITAEDCAEAAVYLVSDQRVQRHRGAAAGRRRVRRTMTATERRARPARPRRAAASSSTSAAATTRHSGGGYDDDPYPSWHELREQAPVHAGIVHELTGYHRATRSSTACRIPDRPHFSAFSYEACDAAYRDPRCSPRRRPRSRSTPTEPSACTNSMLSMGGAAAPALPRAGAAVVRARKGPVVDRQLDRARRCTR